MPTDDAARLAALREAGAGWCGDDWFEWLCGLAERGLAVGRIREQVAATRDAKFAEGGATNDAQGYAYDWVVDLIDSDLTALQAAPAPEPHDASYCARCGDEACRGVQLITLCGPCATAHGQPDAAPPADGLRAWIDELTDDQIIFEIWNPATEMRGNVEGRPSLYEVNPEKFRERLRALAAQEGDKQHGK